MMIMKNKTSAKRKDTIPQMLRDMWSLFNEPPTLRNSNRTC
jgi:hypothetical protein